MIESSQGKSDAQRPNTGRKHHGHASQTTYEAVAMGYFFRKRA